MASVVPQRAVRLKERRRFGFSKYGYTFADGRIVPDEYLVKITSVRNRCTIIAPLQEDIIMRVESRWEPFIPVSMLSMGNVLTQAVSGLFGERRSLITRATSRRIWQGSTPLVLSLRLKFEAVENARREVLLPGQLLQAMALPSDPSTNVSGFQGLKEVAKEKGVWDVISKLPALQPPGPSPFSLDDILTGRKSYPEMTETEVRESVKGGDFIMVEIGRFLTFFNVIVREDTLSYKIKFTSEGDPVEADADVVFETYEMMTVEGLRSTYEKYTPTKSVGK